MTGIRIRYDFRDEEIERGLAGLLDRMENRLGFHKLVGERVVGSTKDRFANEEDPDGRKWQPLKARTIRQRKARGQVPITILRTGRSEFGVKQGSGLAGSISHDPSVEEVAIGSTKEYAAIHQLGGSIKKPASTRWMAGRRFAKRSEHPEGREVKIRAHTITIPARPFIGISAADERGIFEDAEAWLRP